MFEFLKNRFFKASPKSIEKVNQANGLTNNVVPASAKSTLQKAYDRAVIEARVQRKGLDRPQDASLFDAIENKRAEDPLIGPKLGKQEVIQMLLEVLSKTDPKGVHVESLLCILGSLAGYACQASIFAKAVLNGSGELRGINVIGTTKGNFLLGDALNKPLAESEYSIWALTVGYAKHLGYENALNMNEIFSYVVGTLGTENFGKPRFPRNSAGDLPINYVTQMWPWLLPTLKFFCKTPDEWPILFGLAIQEAMELSKGNISPEEALIIVMESAVPMSKVSL